MAIEDRPVSKAELEAYLAEVKLWLDALASLPKHDDWLDRVLGWLQYLLPRRH